MNRKNLVKQALEGRKYLRFDNLNFKIAVLQHLIYEKKVLDLPQDFPVYEEYLEEDYLYYASDYIRLWGIPIRCAENVTDLYITPGDDIYELLDPAGTAESDQFEINQISDREANQFCHLKNIAFCGMSSNVERLTVQMRKNGITTRPGNSEDGKSVSMIGSIIFLLCVTIVSGALMGRVFFQRYGQLEVEVITEQPEGMKEDIGIEDDTEAGTGQDTEQGNIDPVSKEIIDNYIKEIMENIEGITE